MVDDVFDWPPKWRREVLPRRGGSGGTGVGAPRAGAPRVGRTVADPPAATLARRGDRVRTQLGRPGHEPDIVEEGLRAVALVTLSRETASAEAAGMTPLGAAVAVLAGLIGLAWAERDDASAVADLVFELRGPVFAAQTVAELGGLCIAGSAGPGGHTVIRRRTGADGPTRAAEAQPSWEAFAAQVRRLLGTVSDDEHRQVVTALADYRDGVLVQRAVVSYLVPDQREWVSADVAAARNLSGSEVWLLLHAADTTEQAAALVPGMMPWNLLNRPWTLPTLIDGVGPGLAPILDGWVDRRIDTGDARTLLDTIARLPGDDAYALLLARAGRKLGGPELLEATRRFPERAVRMLALRTVETAPPDKLLTQILRDTVITQPEAADRALSTLDKEAAVAAERIRELRDEVAAVVEAKPDALPGILVSPPWAAGKKRAKPAKPAVVDGLVAPRQEEMAWLPGERDEWLAYRDQVPRELDHGITWVHGGRLLVQRRLNSRQTEILFAWGPDEVVRPLLQLWRRSWYDDEERVARVGVARFELAVLPYVVREAERSPATAGRYLLPYAGSDLAERMAGWYARLRNGRAVATRWFDRHAGLAARTLIPVALGPAAKGPTGNGTAAKGTAAQGTAAQGTAGTGTAQATRPEAEQVLRLLAGRAHAVAVLETATGYGPAARDAIAALLETDPLDVLPAKVPVLPGWLDVRLLPPVTVRDGTGAVPAEAVGHLCVMLAMSRLDAPYAGIALVKEKCRLADFAWALFERWEQAGAPSADGWVLQALGLIGDDETVRRLTPLIRAWPGEGGHTRAVAGLDVLRAIGTDVALMHLYGISEKVKFKGLRERARQKVTEIADELGLTADELADRLVPTFGLEDDDGPVLDFGPRQFTVGFDEQLKPYVVDESGKTKAALPKPGAKDDPTLAPEAVKRLAALKKDVRTVSADQLRRLEQAMVTGRTWPAGDFRQYLAGHPLLRHIVRRLVWLAGGPDEAAAFRVAEDGTFASVDDEAWELADDATVRIAHPIDLGEPAAAGRRERWAELFADYEILQPFPQLTRDTYALTAAESASTALTRWKNRTVPTGKLLGLERRGWRRAAPQDNGGQPWMEKDLPGAGRRTLLIMMDPGMSIGLPTDNPEQRIGDAFILLPHDSAYRPTDAPPLGTLDAITASELIRDMEEVVR